MRLKNLPIALLTLAAIWGCQSVRQNHGSAAEEPWRVRLTWQTETESNAFGFYIHRAESPEGETRVINAQSPVHAAGTTTIPQRYRFYDLEVEAGKTYYYKLEQVDLDGSSQFIVGADQLVPGEAKPLTPEESDEIQQRGIMYREEATG